MRRMVRPAVVLASASLVLLAVSAGATSSSTSVTFKDPAGDSASPSKNADITSVKFSTSGKGVGKQYVPKVLVITMTLATPATKDGTTEYLVAGSVAGCGEYYLTYVPGTRLGGTFAYADCGSPPDETGDTGTSFDFAPTVEGNTVTFRTNLKDMPGKVTAGTEFDQLRASTDLVEPATGIFGVGITGKPFYDTAMTKATYTVR